MQGLSEGHRVAFETLEQRLLLSVNYPDDFAPQTLELVVGPQATPDGGWYFGPILPGGLQPDALILNRNAADILIDLARLRAATGAPDEARRLAEEALLITERSGYVLQGADAHLELAKLALARGDKATALDHAKEARRLATCDGPPDYTYQAAYDEAGALVGELESHREVTGGAGSK